MKRRIEVAVLIAILALLVVVAPVLAYIYSAPYVVNESDGNDYAMLAVTSNYTDNVWMANNGFFNDTANDTRIQTVGGLYRPHMVADNKTLCALPVDAYSQNNLYFTTGNSEQDMDIVVGNGGYVTVTDNATLEPGTSANITYDGYFMVGTYGGSAVTKSGSVSIFSTATGVSANLTDSGVADTERPESNGAVALSNFGGATNYDSVDEAVSDDDATYVYQPTGDAAFDYDYYDIPTPALAGDSQVITSITVHNNSRWAVAAGASPSVQPCLKRAGSTGLGTVQGLTAVYTDYDDVIARPGGGAWTVADLVDLQIGTGLKSSVANNVRTTQVWAVIAYTAYINLDYTTAIGEYEVSVGISATDADLYVDGTLEDNSSTVGFTTEDTANDWVFMIGSPYANDIQIHVGGTRILYFAPNDMVIGTVLPDRETGAGSEDGVITWGTNPSGVSVALGGFVSASQYASAVSESETRDILPVGDSSDWFQDPDVAGALLTNPLRPFVTMLSDTTMLSETQAWVFLGLVFVILITAIAIKAVPRHLAIAGIAAGGAILALVVLSVWPMWTLVFVAICIFGGWISERSPSL